MDIVLLCLSILTFLVFSNYSIPLTFFPLVATPRQVSQSMIGIVFASYSFGGAVSALCIGKLMSYYGKVKTCKYAIIHLGVANFLFGLSQYSTNDSLFIVLSTLFRTYTGICTGIIATFVFSQVPQIYPNSISEKMMIMELIFTLGLSTGAIIGKIFYQNLGYFNSFVVISIGSLVIGLLAIQYLSNYFDQQSELKDSQSEHDNNNIVWIGDYSQKESNIVVQQDDKKSVQLQAKQNQSDANQNSNSNSNIDQNNQSIQIKVIQNQQQQLDESKSLLDYVPFIKNKQFIITNINITWVVVMNTSLFTFSSQELGQLKEQSYSDAVFIIFSISYCLGMLGMITWYPQTLDYRWAIFLGFILQYGGFIFLSQLQDSKGAQEMLVGSFIIGIGTSVCFIFTANQLIIIGESIYPQADSEQLSDMCSGFYNTSNMIGELLGPFISGFLFQYFGFKNLCMIIGLIAILISILYFYLGQVYSLIKDSNDQYKDIEIDEISHSEFKIGEVKVVERMDHIKTDIDQDTQRPFK